MASDEAREPAGHDPAESLIDDLIRDILSEAGQPPKARGGGVDTMATLIEKAIVSGPSTTPKSSVIERLLLAQALASALAEALAPALAETLAPEIMKALEHYTTSEDQEGSEVASATSPAGRREQKKDAKS